MVISVPLAWSLPLRHDLVRLIAAEPQRLGRGDAHVLQVRDGGEHVARKIIALGRRWPAGRAPALPRCGRRRLPWSSSGLPSVSMMARPGMTPPILKPASSRTPNGRRLSCSSIGTVGRIATLRSAVRDGFVGIGGARGVGHLHRDQHGELARRHRHDPFPQVQILSLLAADGEERLAERMRKILARLKRHALLLEQLRGGRASRTRHRPRAAAPRSRSQPGASASSKPEKLWLDLKSLGRQHQPDARSRRIDDVGSLRRHGECEQQDNGETCARGP